MKDVTPFFATVATPTRALGQVLPAVATTPAISPWTPGNQQPQPTVAGAAMPTPAIDADTIRAAAREQGLAEGLRETEALRARLTQLCSALEHAHAAIVPPAAELIADAAACVVGAWIEGVDRRELFAPIVSGWLARAAAEPATARVHPSEAAIVAELAKDSKLVVLGDPGVSPGDIRIRGAALELACAWTDRLGELRRAIAEALTGGAEGRVA